MKKILLSLFMFVAMLAYFTPAFSQKMSNMTASERANHLTDWMKTNLHLTSDQVTQVSDINTKYAEKNQAIYNGTETKEKKADMVKANVVDKDAQIKKVLTAEQYKTYMSKKGSMKHEVDQKMKK